jgi:hypothetical protein
MAWINGKESEKRGEVEVLSPWPEEPTRKRRETIKRA